MGLEIKDLHVSYGKVPVLRGVSLHVEDGEIITIIGPNGAGKSTLLRGISGLNPITRGEIWFRGERIDHLPSHAIVARGIAHVPEGRRLFRNMSARENLQLGGYLRERQEIRESMKSVIERFPVLGTRAGQRAGSMSGGEQQMLAIARAIMAKPQLLMLDEPSIGLAPRIVHEIAQLIGELNRASGITMILIEQNVQMALNVATRGYLLELGRFIASGPSVDLLRDDRVRKAYLSS